MRAWSLTICLFFYEHIVCTLYQDDAVCHRSQTEFFIDLCNQWIPVQFLWDVVTWRYSVTKPSHGTGPDTSRGRANLLTIV